MIRYILLTTFFVSFCYSVTVAQKNLTIEDCVMGAVTYLAPEDMEQLAWRPGTKYYTYVEENSLVQITAGETKKTILADAALVKYFALLDKLDFPTGFPEYRWIDSDNLLFFSGNKLIVYNLKTKTYHSAQPGKNADNIHINPSGSYAAFTIGNNLYLHEFQTGLKTAINENENTNIVSGQTVSRNEFGITQGTFWSPDGTRLAFYVKDESDVTGYPLVDITARVADTEIIKYPMAGMGSEVVSIGIYNTVTRSMIFIDNGKPDDHYLTNLAWTPDSKEIYIAEINRGQDTLKMNRYNAETGKFISTVFTETDEKYVDPLAPPVFLPRSNSEFIWLSRRDGYNHFYHYTVDGRERQITKGEWEVLSFKGFNHTGSGIFFTATKDGYINEMFYLVDIASGSITLLTTEPGIHDIILNAEEGLFIDRFTSFTVPKRITLLNTMGKSLMTLHEAADPLKEYTRANVETRTIKAADGVTELTCRLFTPSGGLTPGTKYPAIIYVYNGPLNQLILNSWINRTELWLSYMAEQGYIGFILDGRGSMNRGKEFEQIIFRRLGEVEMQDQLKGVEFLKSLGYVDPGRIGVFGWSYGGFMTTSLMTSYPGVFKAGVAGGPVTDWKFYEVMYGERYMDTPSENPEGYRNTSVLEKAGNLQGRLLIIHGGMDPVVVWQHSLMLLKEFIDEGVLVDYFVYPTHEHNVTGQDRVHLMKKVTDFLMRNL